MAEVDVTVELIASPEVSVGLPEQGPAGPPGQPAESIRLAPAGSTVNGHRAVIKDTAGQVLHADLTNPLHAGAIWGISLDAGILGQDVRVQSLGEINEPSWNWTPLEPVFVGAGGVLTQTPPETGFVVQVGFATSSTSMEVRIGLAVELEEG